MPGDVGVYDWLRSRREAYVRAVTPVLAAFLVLLNAASRYASGRVWWLVVYVAVGLVLVTPLVVWWSAPRLVSFRVLVLGVVAGTFGAMAFDVSTGNAPVGAPTSPMGLWALAAVTMGGAWFASYRIRPAGWLVEDKGGEEVVPAAA